MACILITGANGMIGSHLSKALLNKDYKVIGIDKTKQRLDSKEYIHIQVNLNDKVKVEDIYRQYPITHTIHLAALAHTKGVVDLSEGAYRQANVINAQNVFEAAKNTNILFISTVDVYGFIKDTINANTKAYPVSIYGKTKYEAETILKKQGGKFNIYRFSPVYTENIKRDIQKRYYLKYPNWAYIIGKGSEYEVLNIENAVAAMVDWVKNGSFDGSIMIVKDKDRLNTAEVIALEKKANRAKHVLCFPRWIVNIGYIIGRMTGKNKYTYLLNKVVYPFRSEM
jgi:nucleoside-diphosphate-sugar epimerase